MSIAVRALTLLALVSSPALAQDSLPATATKRAATVEWLRNLPIDFLEGYFILEPGIGPIEGGYSLRGGEPHSFAAYVDGTPVSPGYRGAAEGFLGAAGSQLQLPVTGVRDASITTGVLDLGIGNGEAGAVTLWTAAGAGKVVGTFDFGTDGLWGAGASLGLNRLQATLGGAVGRRLTFSLAGALIGQGSAAYGAGQEQVPIYEVAGVDTTVLVGATSVEVMDFAASEGLRVPSTTTSNYQLLGRLSYAIAAGTDATFTAAGSQVQSRLLDYLNLYNPAQLQAQRSSSYAYTLTVRQRLGGTTDRPRHLEVALSAQGDEFESGPLTTEGEANSRDPAGGFLVAPLAFRFGLDEFPVNEELVTNVLLNTPGSRRSPYDLENTAQYALVDQYRNNAYGLLGFSESGGPVGRLRLMEEQRLVGRLALDWALDSRQALRLGGEFVGYDLANYTHALTSQAFSDVYVEQPSRQGYFVEDRITAGRLLAIVGVRYDRFSTGAQRVDGAPRISSNPAFDPNDPASVDALMTADQPHAAWSPRVQFGYRASASTALRAGVGRQVQAPDFGLSLAGISTDMAVTSSAQVYGTDLGYASTVLYELGVAHRFSPSTSVDLAAFGRSLTDQVTVTPVQEFDPLRQTDVTVLRFTNEGQGKVTGAEIRLDQRLGPYFQAFAGYTYQHATVSDGLVASWSRPHTLAGAVGGTLPAGWHAGSVLGSVLQEGGAWATFRFASGAPYTACTQDVANAGVLSSEPCLGGVAGEFNAENLPATSQFDLKLARSFTVGRARVTGYLDIRNLFNFDNTNAVYAQTGTRESPMLQLVTWLGDSAGFSGEAAANGVLLPGGGLDLRFGGAGAGGCGAWVTAGGAAAAPNCVYLVRAEGRFGDGDGVFDLAEQQRASTALYNALHGGQLLSGPGRFVRLGFTVGF